uniref:SGNH hydrolase-type esterase domain-containing protein n=1 Tax=Branchiostoma floridae TaxID=7739 RepID=C3ZXM3_BRAFL|eukprot:XP_002586675.1 hypothetical protein BRAFLDRAFT_105481 [Branchiostoma floridae]
MGQHGCGKPFIYKRKLQETTREANDPVLRTVRKVQEKAGLRKSKQHTPDWRHMSFDKDGLLDLVRSLQSGRKVFMRKNGTLEELNPLQIAEVVVERYQMTRKQEANKRRTQTASGRAIDPSFWMEDCEISFRYKPGATVDSFAYGLTLRRLPAANTVHLELGCNDLCNLAYEPKDVAHRVVKTAEEIQDITAAKVVVLALPIKRVFDLPGIPYNARCEDYCDNHVKDEVKNARGIHWWEHSRIVARHSANLFETDGLHFNDYGYFLYYKLSEGPYKWL